MEVSLLEQYSQFIRSMAGRKYDCMGIYSISLGINDQRWLVYIGKSKNMTDRLAHHLLLINGGDKSHKYEIMRQALKGGYQIYFDKLDTADNIDELGFLEGYYIRQYKPCLNYQIPNPDNYHRFTINKKAKIITLQEIVC